MFIEAKTSDAINKMLTISLDDKEPSIEQTNDAFSMSPLSQINSIVHLDNDQDCQISFENLKNLSSDYFVTDDLEDENEIIRQVVCVEKNTDIVIDEDAEKKLSYYEKCMLSYQRVILDEVCDFII